MDEDLECLCNGAAFVICLALSVGVVSWSWAWVYWYRCLMT